MLPPACPWQHVPPPATLMQQGSCSSLSPTASPSFPSLSSPHFGLLHSTAQEELLGPAVSLPPTLTIPQGLPAASGPRGLGCQRRRSNSKGPAQSHLGGHGSTGETVSNPQHLPNCHASIASTSLHPCTTSSPCFSSVFHCCLQALLAPSCPRCWSRSSSWDSLCHPPATWGYGSAQEKNDWRASHSPVLWTRFAGPCLHTSPQSSPHYHTPRKAPSHSSHDAVARTPFHRCVLSRHTGDTT